MTLEEQLKESPRLKAWHDEFHSSLASIASVGFGNLVPGWPDAQFDELDHDVYLEHCRDLLDRAINETEDGKDVTVSITLPTFKEWKDKLKEGDLQDRDNLGFSHDCCELCGALAGNRHAVTALPDDPSTNSDYYTYEVCGDCLAFIANGDLPNLD